ncbi:hypothetical protein F5X98DRAFT_232708 [Xylaria grammica]|nr:hypothetical protein F5X98DRAFT_232708 [Xylaria grammica]
MGIALSKSSPEHGLFTCFKRLPAELRLEIWKQSLPPRNMMLNVQPHPEGVRRVIRSDDWHGGLPAHLFTCWEARHVALARCPWKYNKIDILYLAGRMNAYFGADGTWGPYAGRERILAIDDGCPFWYKTKKYERFRPHEGHPRVTRSISKLGGLFGGLDRIETRKGGCGQVLFVVGTLKCKEPEWLFANSDLVILALHDPRLKQALDSYPRIKRVDRTKKLVGRGIGSCFFLTGDEQAPTHSSLSLLSPASAVPYRSPRERMAFCVTVNF